MAIVVLSRWKGSYEQALPILREASPLMKKAGATFGLNKRPDPQ